jgi:hypothetical protein
VPITLGAGTRLFDGVPQLNLEQVESRAASSVTHVTYRVLSRAGRQVLHVLYKTSSTAPGHAGPPIRPATRVAPGDCGARRLRGRRAAARRKGRAPGAKHCALHGVLRCESVGIRSST